MRQIAHQNYNNIMWSNVIQINCLDLMEQYILNAQEILTYIQNKRKICAPDYINILGR